MITEECDRRSNSSHRLWSEGATEASRKVMRDIRLVYRRETKLIVRKWQSQEDVDEVTGRLTRDCILLTAEIGAEYAGWLHSVCVYRAQLLRVGIEDLTMSVGVRSGDRG